MTRRELGKLAAAGSIALLPAARARAQAGYGGALEGSEGKVDAAAFDPVLYTRKLYESAPRLVRESLGTSCSITGVNQIHLAESGTSTGTPGGTNSYPSSSTQPINFITEFDWA